MNTGAPGAAQDIVWPAKSRELQNHHMDSARWNEFQHRDGDVVIATWGKAGTTWVQQVARQLILGGTEDAGYWEQSPWLEHRLAPIEDVTALLESQDHRRCIKTHLPVDALTFSPRARYIYVGRDARDVLWSMYSFHASFRPVYYDLLNDMPGRVGPALEPPHPDIHRYYRDWLERDGYPFWPFWSHVQSWWDVRGLPNVLLVHFARLKADMEGEIRRMASFLQIDIDPQAWPGIVEHCGFDYMKRHAGEAIGRAELTLENGAQAFINKGENGRWRDVLTPEEVAMADEAAAANLTPDCAHWLRTGELPA